jgi:hypothetical protein
MANIELSNVRSRMGTAATPMAIGNSVPNALQSASDRNRFMCADPHRGSTAPVLPSCGLWTISDHRRQGGLQTLCHGTDTKYQQAQSEPTRSKYPSLGLIFLFRLSSHIDHLNQCALSGLIGTRQLILFRKNLEQRFLIPVVAVSSNILCIFLLTALALLSGQLGSQCIQLCPLLLHFW